MLIGQKDLCKAAYFQAAPHHCYGRALKCSKEEAMGLLAAVQQWYKRDHAAEQLEWLSWLKSIQARLQGLPSTSFEYVQPEDLSNKCPQLRIHWNANVLRITGTELAARLDAGTPRIVVDEATGGRPDMMASSIIIMPYMMEKGEERIIANAIYEGLTKPGHYEAPVISALPHRSRGYGLSLSSTPAASANRNSRSGKTATILPGYRTVRFMTRSSKERFTLIRSSLVAR